MAWMAATPSRLTADASGNLYGTTYLGGADGYGTVFKIDAGTNHLTDLIQFNANNGLDGGNPYILTADAGGNLYGATQSGGQYGDGTLFKIDAGTNHLTDIAPNDGNITSLAADASGNLYGTTAIGGVNDGSVFKIDAGTNHLTDLIQFNGGVNGAYPSALVTDGSGNLYGTTQSGGLSYDGTVFKIDAGTSHLTDLIQFKDGMDGAGPTTLIADTRGDLYGTTAGGGLYYDGTLFELSPTVAVPEPTSFVLAALGRPSRCCSSPTATLGTAHLIFETLLPLMRNEADQKLASIWTAVTRASSGPTGTPSIEISVGEKTKV